MCDSHPGIGINGLDATLSILGEVHLKEGWPHPEYLAQLVVHLDSPSDRRLVSSFSREYHLGILEVG